MTITITALNLYPVKSLRGIPLAEAELTATGLRHDRRWMLVNANGRFVTQRDLPRLALVTQALDEDGVVLSLPGHGELRVGFDEAGNEPPFHTAVWGDDCEVLDVGAGPARWLSGALQHPLRLVRMAPRWKRPQRHPELMGADTRAVFADGAPLLIASESTLETLNAELAGRGVAAVPMNRFRPNVVVRGLAPFAEHATALLAHADYALRLCYPCERCVVTTIDQATGVRDPARQPFLALKEINPMPGRAPAPAFAQNSAVARGIGARIRVGDALGWQAG